MQLIDSANRYISNGLSIIPTDNTKKSLFSWKPFQSRFMTPQEIKKSFSHPKVKGIAVICGSVSGGLEVIDVDCKYGIDFNEFAEEIKKASIVLFAKLYIVKTKSNGYHLYYRCEQIEGNQKLANRPATDDELKLNPNLKEFVLIETRGEGGYVVAPPSEGYTVIQGKGLQVLSIEEREILMNCARSFNQVYEEAKIPMAKEAINYGKTPWDDYNDRGDIVGLLEKHGWTKVDQKVERIYFRRPGAASMTSANFHTGKKVFYVWTTSSEFQNKGYSPFGVYAILECKGDFKQATRQLVDQGYGEKKDTVDAKLSKKIVNLISTGYTESDIVDELMSSDGLQRISAEETLGKIQKDLDASYLWFWDIAYTQQNVKIKINKVKLERYLQEKGFGLYFHNPNSLLYMFIHSPHDEGYIEEVSNEQVKKFIKNEIEKLPDQFDKEPGGKRFISKQDLLETLYQNSEYIFNNAFYEFLNHKKPEILKDTKDEAYFPFRNGVVVINKNKVELKNYSDINKKIWKSQINFDRHIIIDQDFDPQLSEYYRFIEKICDDDDNRIAYAMTLIGYILHSYKDPAKPYAPILAEETDDENKGGGTGKGIFIKALSYLIPTVRIDGKTFKVDKTFAFQRVSLGDKLVVIEDCARNVDFEKYYPTITEGMTIERKNKGELFLAYDESPKIAFTTNYSINSTAEHAKRRQRIFEFSSHFNSTYTPMDMFGHKLFDDWDADEWNRFYNLMFFCVSLYLDQGLVELKKSDKMLRKHVKLSFGEEFLDFFDTNIKTNLDSYRQLSDDWKAFLMINELDKKDYSLKRFKKAVDEYVKLFDLNIEWTTLRQTGNTKNYKITKKQ